MFACLRAKFQGNSELAEALKKTGEAFLLEHNSIAGRDTVWSDNCDGDGTNWLGLQLMLLRDQLCGKSAWTAYICRLIDRETGSPLDAIGQRTWQAAIRSA